jgi:hypothetical protein
MFVTVRCPWHSPRALVARPVEPVAMLIPHPAIGEMLNLPIVSSQGVQSRPALRFPVTAGLPFEARLGFIAVMPLSTSGSARWKSSGDSLRQRTLPPTPARCDRPTCYQSRGMFLCNPQDRTCPLSLRSGRGRTPAQPVKPTDDVPKIEGGVVNRDAQTMLSTMGPCFGKNARPQLLGEQG